MEIISVAATGESQPLVEPGVGWRIFVDHAYGSHGKVWVHYPEGWSVFRGDTEPFEWSEVIDYIQRDIVGGSAIPGATGIVYVIPPKATV